jgi:hypothetical protein
VDVRIDRQVIPKALRSEIEAFDVGVDTKLIVELGSNNGLYQVQIQILDGLSFQMG